MSERVIGPEEQAAIEILNILGNFSHSAHVRILDGVRGLTDLDRRDREVRALADRGDPEVREGTKTEPITKHTPVCMKCGHFVLSNGRCQGSKMDGDWKCDCVCIHPKPEVATEETP